MLPEPTKEHSNAQHPHPHPHQQQHHSHNFPEVHGIDDLPTACLILGELGTAAPVPGIGGNSTKNSMISAKLMALDALWSLGGWSGNLEMNQKANKKPVI